jgi:outer membrane protein assembly factor BamB
MIKQGNNSYTSGLLAFFLIIGILLIAGCKKDEDDNFTPSPRQLNTFSKGKAGFALNPPTLIGDFIYIGTSGTMDNAFYKLDKNLNEVWEYPMGQIQVIGAATLDSYGNIYFIAGPFMNGTDKTYKLLSLDNNGNIRWSKRIMTGYLGVENEPNGVACPAISIDDHIYAAGDSLYAFDVNGNVIWAYNPMPNGASAAMRTCPIIDPAGNIYFIARHDGSIFGDANGELISVDQNGNERWRALNGYNCWLSHPAFSVDYSKVYFATYNELFCISTSDGSIIWQYSIPGMTGDFRGTPAVDDQDNVYIGSHHQGGEDDASQTMYAIKGDGTGLLWQNNIGDDLYSSPTLGNDRVLYVGSEDYYVRHGYKMLHAISMSTGERLWTAPMESDVIYSSAAISSDGTLYIATMTKDDLSVAGKVYSFKTDCTGLLPNSGSPRFHEGNASTGRRE